MSQIASAQFQSSNIKDYRSHRDVNSKLSTKIVVNLKLFEQWIKLRIENCEFKINQLN